MKKIFLTVAISILAITTISAQSYKESFDTNSLEWTECGYKNGTGTAIIEKGAMTIKSNGEKKALSALASAASGISTKVGSNTFFETHCYAPIDVQKPFEIHSKVNVKQLAEDRLVGLVFNYKDGGNFYTFSFNDQFVQFVRYVDGQIVGTISQGIKSKGKRKADMKWSLYSEGQTLVFKVDDVTLLKIKYMPLTYSGFGFYAFGNQELVVDEVEFKQ